MWWSIKPVCIFAFPSLFSARLCIFLWIVYYLHSFCALSLIPCHEEFFPTFTSKTQSPWIITEHKKLSALAFPCPGPPGSQECTLVWLPRVIPEKWLFLAVLDLVKMMITEWTSSEAPRRKGVLREHRWWSSSLGPSLLLLTHMQHFLEWFHTA